MDRRTIRRPRYAVILPRALGAMLLLATAGTAQNTFTPTVDNDLANPANWSLGTLPSPTDNVIIDFGSSPTLTLSADLELGPASLIGSGEFDLTGHELIFNPGIEQTGPLLSGPSQFTFQGGSWRGNFGSFPNFNPGANIVWDNNEYDGRFVLESVGDVDVHITNGSDLAIVGRVQANNNGPVPSNLNVRIDGASKVAGASSDPFRRWELAGQETTNVVITEGAQLTGGSFVVGAGNGFFGTNSTLLFEDGAKGSPTTQLFVVGSSASTTVTGAATQIELLTITLLGGQGTGISFGELFRSSAELIVADGAGLSLTDTGPPIINANEFVTRIFELTFVNQLKVRDDGSSVNLANAPHVFVSAEVTDGATLVGNHHSEILATLLVDHASVIGDVKNSILSQALIRALTQHGISEVVVNHGSILGDVSNYKFLALDHGLIDGSVVDVTTIEGNGHITGDVVEGDFEIPLETIDPNGLIQIDGDVSNLFSVDEFHFEGRGGVNDQIWIGGSILGLDAFPVRDFATSLLFTFAPTFQSSVGDRYELLRIDGTPLRLFPGVDIPPDLVQTILDADFDPEGLPEGYAIRMFLEEHALGFTVTSVPEVSSVQLLAGLFAGVLVIGRSRLGRRA